MIFEMFGCKWEAYWAESEFHTHFILRVKSAEVKPQRPTRNEHNKLMSHARANLPYPGIKN